MAPSKPKVAKPSVGIDLGTTYSCVAVFQNGRPEVIANSQGNRITPSVVAFIKEGRLIGEGAEIQRKLDPANAIYNAKRFIGRTWDDPVVQENCSQYPFKVVENNKKIQFQVVKGQKTVNFTPEEIGAALLSKLKKIAEDYLEEAVKDVVITVPAYFNDSQRQATVNAGNIAGLRVTRIINEPTAAAMAYGLREGAKEDEGKHILVYDLGGGTFDVSILEIEEDLIQVKSTAGNTNLGGEDFNDILVNHFKQEILRKHKVDLTTNFKAIRRLTGACEKLKKNLSAENNKTSKVELDNFLPNGKDFVSSLTRAKFENLCKQSFDETIKCVERALKDAELSKDDIDEIVLVGGSSRIPKLQSMLSAFFNNKVLNKSINPDEAVACGAAVQAAIINNDPHLTVKDMLLLDVIPLSIGINTGVNTTTIVLERNTAIPVRRTHFFKTGSNYQSRAPFQITEGERTMTTDNKILGSFSINGLPPRKAGEVEFDAEFEVDESGILKVSATVRGTNMKSGITLDPRSSGRLSDGEVKRLVKEAEKMKSIDENEENRMLALNKLTSLCNHISFESQDLIADDVDRVIRSVNDCFRWIRDNPDAKEDQFSSKYKELNDIASKTLNLSSLPERSLTLRSSHVLRMGKQKAKYCLKEGKDLLLSSKVNDKLKAAENFFKAYKIASDEGQVFKQIEAIVHFGQTHKTLATTVTDEKEKLEHALKATRGLSLAMALEKNKSLSEEERQTVIEDLKFAAEESFNMIEKLEEKNKFDTLYKFMLSLDRKNALENSEYSEIVFMYRLKEMKIILKRMDICLENDDIKEAQHAIQSLNYSKEQAKLLARSPAEKRQLTEIIDAIQVNMLHVEGLNEINLAVNLLEGVEVDHPDATDKALMALDHLNEAKHLTKEDSYEVYIRANFFEGKIFMDYILNSFKAKSCFEFVVTASNDNDLNTEESRQAKNMLEEIQKEWRIKEEEIPENIKEKLLDELQEDLQKIKAANASMSDAKFIDFLFSEYPPKHKENCKKPAITTNASKKKAYIRLSTFYHPDKVDASEHGDNYKALCGEISKYVNGRFLKM